MTSQIVYYKVKCKYCRGRFVGRRVVPVDEPLYEFTATLKAFNFTKPSQLQYILAKKITEVEGILPVYVCDMQIIDKQIDYGTHYQISMFDKEVFA